MARFHSHLGLASSFATPSSQEDDEEEEEEEEGEKEEDDEEEEIPFSSSPLILPGTGEGGEGGEAGRERRSGNSHQHHYSLLAVLVAALRKSLVMCSSVGAVVEDGHGGPCWSPCSSVMEIGRPTDVRHIAHVTFDRFDGFLGLPAELEPEVPRRAPSASASVFGVSAESMQCSYDSRGNSVPTILLAMQRHLYLQGGLQAEGIFRINAENSQEMYVRDQLNRGTVPHGIDLHCLAGLIKAWFRELPKGVLDSLTPDQVMHCNTEEQCSELVRMLPPTEAALLDWAINLMADVVEHEYYNKMNARNIAMVFAPNMTQMADPLTALIHAVQVMNLLKTLIIKTLQEREEAARASRVLSSCSESPTDHNEFRPSETTEGLDLCANEKTPDFYALDKCALGEFLFSAESTLKRDTEESFHSFEKKSLVGEECELISRSSSINSSLDRAKHGSKSEFANGEAEGVFDRLKLRKGVRKLCRHPVLQLSRSSKKFADHSFIVSRGEGREAYA